MAGRRTVWRFGPPLPQKPMGNFGTLPTPEVGETSYIGCTISSNVFDNGWYVNIHCQTHLPKGYDSPGNS
jgi:hypothetical protein